MIVCQILAVLAVAVLVDLANQPFPHNVGAILIVLLLSLSNVGFFVHVQFPSVLLWSPLPPIIALISEFQPDEWSTLLPL